MDKFKSFILLLTLLLSFQIVTFGQCQDDIDKANKLYEDGIYKDAEKLIKKTLVSCSLSETQENELLKLLASILYEIDEIEEGDEYIIEFLKKNPFYTPSKKNDPLPFREAIEKLKFWPRFSVGIRGGIPLGSVETEKVFPVLDTADYLQPYTIKPSFLVGIDLGWNLNKFISINLGGGLRVQKIQHQVPQYNQIYFNYEEVSTTINLPLTFQFSIPTGSAFVPALFFGGEFELFADASYSYSYTGNSNITNDFSFYLNRKRNDVVIEKDQRNAYRYAALGGIKLMYKLERFSLFADCRYVKEFDLYNNPKKRYKNRDMYFENNYTLSDIKLTNIDISVGFLYHFSYIVKSKY